MEVVLSGYPNTMSGKKTTHNGNGTTHPHRHPKFVTGVKSTMAMAGKDWEKHLTNIKKASGKDNTINV